MPITSTPPKEVFRSLDQITHWHAEHTPDKITRFKGMTERGPLTVPVVVYVTTDSEWIERLNELTASEFPDSSSKPKEKVHV